jgi:hypothetical protein
MPIDVIEREHVAIDDLTSRLISTFASTHTVDQVRSAVLAAYHRFDDRPIRDFVPVLVERLVKEKLSGR